MWPLAGSRAPRLAVQQVANGALQKSGGTMNGNINMGGNSITNVAAPVNGGDAANKSYVDSQVSTVNTNIAGLTNAVNQAFKDIDRTTQGVAMAMAMGGGFLDDNHKFSMWADWATFEGYSAFAATGYARVNRDVILTGSLPWQPQSSEIGTRLGVGIQW
jgi:hypothetical protein